jgi:hypothetical protein
MLGPTDTHEQQSDTIHFTLQEEVQMEWLYWKLMR